MDGAQADAATADEALQDEIMTAEFTTWDDLMAHDVEATRAEIAEDFIMINADGDRLGQRGFAGDRGRQALTFEEPVRDNVVVWRLGPDTAMIVYVIDYKGSYDGDAFSRQRGDCIHLADARGSLAEYIPAKHKAGECRGHGHT